MRGTPDVSVGELAGRRVSDVDNRPGRILPILWVLSPNTGLLHRMASSTSHAGLTHRVLAFINEDPEIPRHHHAGAP